MNLLGSISDYLDRRIYKPVPSLVSLLIICICLFITGFLFWQGAWLLSEINPPAPLAFLTAGIAAVVLWLTDFPRLIRAPKYPRALSTLLPLGLNAWSKVRLGTSILLVVLLLAVLPFWPDQFGYSILLLIWIVAIALYVLAVCARRPEARRSNLLARDLPIIVALLLTIGLRIWRVEAIPFTLGGDEASLGLGAIQVLNGATHNPFATGWLGMPTLAFFFSSLPIRVLGQTVLALRLPWVLVGTVTVAACFRLVSKVFGFRIGITTAILLTVYHYHIHFSRLGSNQIADPLFAALALLFLFCAVNRSAPINWVLTGVICGLALYSYSGARLTPILVAASTGYWLLLDPCNFWRQHRYGILLALGAFLVVGAPLLEYAVRFPDLFNERINQVGLIQSGLLTRYLAEGRSLPAILLDQFLKSMLAFNFYSDRTFWYGLGEPLLDPVFGALFLLGLGYSSVSVLSRRADKRLFPFVCWWWSAILLGGMFTENPPSSQRLVTLTLPVCFFIALSLGRLVELAQNISGHVSARLVFPATALAFAIISLSS